MGYGITWRSGLVMAWSETHGCMSMMLAVQLLNEPLEKLNFEIRSIVGKAVCLCCAILITIKRIDYIFIYLFINGMEK